MWWLFDIPVPPLDEVYTKPDVEVAVTILEGNVVVPVSIVSEEE